MKKQMAIVLIFFDKTNLCKKTFLACLNRVMSFLNITLLFLIANQMINPIGLRSSGLWAFFLLVPGGVGVL
jgi:hypothetical protein